MNEVDTYWIPGLIALGAGALLGVWGALSLRKRDAGKDQTTATVADLDEQAGNYIAQLRDLEEQRGRQDATAYVAEKGRLEQLAAAAIRERDGRTLGRTMTKPYAAPAEAAGLLGRYPRLQPIAWGVGALAVAAVALFLANRESSARPEGGSATGGSQAGAMGPGPANAGGDAPGLSAEVNDLLQRVTNNPADIDALLRLSHMMLGAHGSDGASDLNDRVLALDPDNSEALIHAAVIRGRDGDAAAVAASVSAIEAVLAKDPSSYEGWFFRGSFAIEQGDSAKVTESWTKYIAAAPEGPEKEQVRMFLRQRNAAAQP